MMQVAKTQSVPVSISLQWEAGSIATDGRLNDRQSGLIKG